MIESEMQSGVFYEATSQLRWLQTGINKTLQQAWRNQVTGDLMWIDVENVLIDSMVMDDSAK